MRKFLVALLILSVMGGAFAQEGAGTWTAGGVSGSVELSTIIDFLPLDDRDLQAGGPYVGTKGGLEGSELKATFNYAKGNWGVAFPIIANKDAFKTDEAKVTYASGPVKVEIPFEFKFAAVDGALPIHWMNAGVTAKYETPNQNFNFTIDNLLGTPTPKKVGGQFIFSNKSELAISYLGGWGTNWWRASEIVLKENMFVWEDIGTDEKIEYGPGAVNENLGNGIAYRFFANDELQFGISFAGYSILGQGGNAIFTNGQYGSANNRELNNFTYDFLLNPTIGVKYEKEGGLAVSGMIGLRYFFDYASTIATFFVPIHAGFKYKFDVGDGLTLQADLSLAIAEKFADTAINFGARAVYGDFTSEDGIWAGLQVKATDITSRLYDTLGTNVNLGIKAKVGYNIKLKDGSWDNSFDDAFGGRKDAALFAGLIIGIDDILIVEGQAMPLNMLAVVGYKGLAIGNNLKLSAQAGFDIGLSLASGGNEPRFLFHVTPQLEWRVIDDNGKITFTYMIKAGLDGVPAGADNKFGVTQNDLKIAYKWSF